MIVFGIAFVVGAILGAYAGYKYGSKAVATGKAVVKAL